MKEREAFMKDDSKTLFGVKETANQISKLSVLYAYQVETGFVKPCNDTGGFYSYTQKSLKRSYRCFAPNYLET
jgi:hypothetical protein